MLFFCKKPTSFLEGRDYENNTVLFLVAEVHMLIFNSSVEVGFQVPAGGCILSSVAQFLMNTKNKTIGHAETVPAFVDFFADTALLVELDVADFTAV